MFSIEYASEHIDFEMYYGLWVYLIVNAVNRMCFGVFFVDERKAKKKLQWINVKLPTRIEKQNSFAKKSTNRFNENTNFMSIIADARSENVNCDQVMKDS